MYGSDPETAYKLRLFSEGKLRYNEIRNEMYCPQDPSKVVKNGSQVEVTVAFIAGN